MRQIYSTMVFEELPWKLLPNHWLNNSIHILIKRETDVLLTPITILNTCKAVSCSRSEIIWAATGCLDNWTLSQWLKNKTHSCSCSCTSSWLPAGLKGAAHAGTWKICFTFAMCTRERNETLRKEVYQFFCLSLILFVEPRPGPVTWQDQCEI